MLACALHKSYVILTACTVWYIHPVEVESVFGGYSCSININTICSMHSSIFPHRMIFFTWNRHRVPDLWLLLLHTSIIYWLDVVQQAQYPIRGYSYSMQALYTDCMYGKITLLESSPLSGGTAAVFIVILYSMHSSIFPPRMTFDVKQVQYPIGGYSYSIHVLYTDCMHGMITLVEWSPCSGVQPQY